MRKKHASQFHPTTLKENPVKFDKSYLSGVIFGLKARKAEIIRIQELVQDYYIKEGIDVLFYRVTDTEVSYNLTVSEISNMDEFISKLKV